MRRLLRMAAVLAVLGLLTTEASAAPIAYEPFQYSAGSLPPNNGGFGFAGPWVGDAGVMVQPGVGLSKSPPGLAALGSMIGGGFNASRPLSAPIGPSTFWASFLIKYDPG